VTDSRLTAGSNPAPASRSWLAPGVCAALALALRLVALVALSDSPFTRVMVGDSKGYLATAELVSSGRLAKVGVFFQSAPLYSLVLAVTSALSDSTWLGVALLQLIAGSLACGAIALSAASAFPALRAAPWVAGAAAACYGPLVYFELEVLPASLATSFVAFALILALRPAGPGRAALSGALFGLASILAPALLLVALWSIPFVLFGAGRAGRLRATFALGALVLVVSPVTVHNIVAGDFVLVSSNAGVNAFIGNNPEATGAFFVPPGSGLDGARLPDSAREVAERDLHTRLSPSEISAYWMRRAADFVASEPLRWLRLMGRKTLLAINHYEIPNHLHFRFVADRFAPGLLAMLPFWIVFPFAGLGAAVALGGRSRPGALLAGAALLALAVPVFFFAAARYRLPAAPAMLALAGGGVAWLWLQAAGRRWWRLLAGLLLLSALVWPTRARLVHEGDYAFDHLLLAEVHRRLGNLDEAVLEVKLAAETALGETDAPLRLALLLEERGNDRAAVETARRMLADDPGDRRARAIVDRLTSPFALERGPEVPRTDFEIGTVLLVEEEDLEGAAEALERAVTRDPLHYRALVNLAIVRLRQDDFASAIDLLMRAATVVPDNSQVWKNLAQVFDKAGNPGRARFSARRALELGLEDDELRRILERREGP
jgi:tetratricopeptide (TPR) repeat protein